MKVLLVEDEADIRELISMHLRREKYEVDEASTAEDAFEKIRKSNHYDLLILDWMLPGLSGIEIAKFIREKGKNLPPILMVTARANAEDIVSGLESGADDYLTKPFETPVLLARVRALLRRSKPGGGKSPVPGETISHGPLTVDMARHKILCEGRDVAMTLSEFKLLAALVSHGGRVLTRDRLVDLVQGEGVSVTHRTIDTHVFGLRKKLGTCSELIESIRGVGYRIKEVP
jgi:two-component system, OmpR family, phosphate regulon response regulator PhoB